MNSLYRFRRAAKIALFTYCRVLINHTGHGHSHGGGGAPRRRRRDFSRRESYRSNAGVISDDEEETDEESEEEERIDGGAGGRGADDETAPLVTSGGGTDKRPSPGDCRAQVSPNGYGTMNGNAGGQSVPQESGSLDYSHAHANHHNAGKKPLTGTGYVYGMVAMLSGRQLPKRGRCGPPEGARVYRPFEEMQNCNK